jgi:hypothetical protein
VRGKSGGGEATVADCGGGWLRGEEEAFGALGLERRKGERHV